MTEIRCAAVLGLGLIGGSLARDLAAAGVRVIGYDRDAATLAAAREEGVLDAVLGENLDGIEEADLVVLAVPVGAAPALLGCVAPLTAAVITDVGSTKASLLRAAESLGIGARFVGSHPVAGDHRSGWRASRRGLFGGQRVFVVAGAHAEPSALVRVEALWRAVGACPVLVGAELHDRRLAWASHLPQVIASAAAVALGTAGVAPEELGAGGRDVTRLAGSSPEMWADIALDNAASLGAALDGVQRALDRFRTLLAAGDEAGLHAWFAQGRDWANAAPGSSAGAPGSVAAG